MVAAQVGDDKRSSLQLDDAPNPMHVLLRILLLLVLLIDDACRCGRG